MVANDSGRRGASGLGSDLARARAETAAAVHNLVTEPWWHGATDPGALERAGTAAAALARAIERELAAARAPAETGS